MQQWPATHQLIIIILKKLLSERCYQQDTEGSWALFSEVPFQWHKVWSPKHFRRGSGSSTVATSVATGGCHVAIVVSGSELTGSPLCLCLRYFPSGSGKRTSEPGDTITIKQVIFIELDYLLLICQLCCGLGQPVVWQSMIIVWPLVATIGSCCGSLSHLGSPCTINWLECAWIPNLFLATQL